MSLEPESNGTTRNSTQQANLGANEQRPLSLAAARAIKSGTKLVRLPRRGEIDQFVPPGDRRFRFDHVPTASEILSAACCSHFLSHYWTAATEIERLTRGGFIECARFEVEASSGLLFNVVRRVLYHARESEEHRELKAQAAIWLMSIGAVDPRFERGGIRRRADVSSESLGIAVECGDTPPETILQVLLEPSMLAIFGYPSVPAAQPVYLFRATAAGLLLGHLRKCVQSEIIREKLEIMHEILYRPGATQ